LSFDLSAFRSTRPEDSAVTTLRCAALIVSVGALLSVWSRPVEGAGFHVRRLTDELHIPVFATTAPGDDNRIFIAQLGGVAGDGTDGDPITKAEGRIVIYDRTTGQVDYDNPFLTISDTSLLEEYFIPEVGLFGMTFHPDFQTNGKFYVNVAVNHSGPAPIVDGSVSEFKTVVREYTVSPGNPNFADPSSARTILSLNQPHSNHNGSWLGFSPQEVAAGERNLYITQGDGGMQRDPANHGQNKNTWFGKVMRVDLDGDDFPADPERNYAIPADNPYVGVDGADELWAIGLRNPWRASFDRLTSDFWIGDVGQDRREEVNFQPASSNGGENYGWRLREGSVATPSIGIGGPPPPGNVNPVYEYFHGGLAPDPNFQGNSVTGGYVYRGPVEELQGKYIFGDAVSGHIWAFDPANPSGTVQNMNALFAPDEGQIVSVTSFGEDNQGNLLIIDGAGQLFQVVPNFALTLTVDRATGAITLSNETGAPTDIRAYSISSGFGGVNATGFQTIAGNFDKPPGGDGSIDPNDSWAVTSTAGDREFFREASLGDGGTLAADAEWTLSAGGGWIRSPVEDLQLSVTLGDGSVVAGTVTYVGNDGAPFGRSDLNFDGEITLADWSVFRSFNLTNLSGLSDAQQYGRGDLNGDEANDFDDFRLFQADYDAVHGDGALAAAARVPEPSGACLALVAASAAFCGRRLRRRFQSPFQNS
jgi:hypothetical protein